MGRNTSQWVEYDCTQWVETNLPCPSQHDEKKIYLASLVDVVLVGALFGEFRHFSSHHVETALDKTTLVLKGRGHQKPDGVWKTRYLVLLVAIQVKIRRVLRRCRGSRSGRTDVAGVVGEQVGEDASWHDWMTNSWRREDRASRLEEKSHNY